MRNLIYTYRQQPEIGWSTVALHSFGADSCIVPVQLTDHALDPGGGIEFSVEGYGYRWLRVRRPQDDPVI
jgi:hypothetical protein